MIIRSPERVGKAASTRSRLLLQIGAVIAFLAGGAPAGFAANRTVCPAGCEYSTIQSAINAASSGDTILISKGHYFETIVIAGKRLTLQGADRRTTIIDANGEGTAVTIGHQTAESATLVALADVTVTRGFGDNGGGISVLSRGSLVLRHCTIVSNHSTTEGGGINVFSDGTVTIADSTITNNDSIFTGGGIAATGEGTTVSIMRTTVSANRSSQGSGGGISLAYDGSKLTLTDTDIVDNSARSAGGAFLGSGVPGNTVTVQNVLINGNTATQDTGGLWIAGAASLERVVLAHNIAGTSGGGVSTFEAFRGGGIITLNDVYVVQNKAGTEGGGILNNEGLAASMTVVADNQPDNCVQPTTGTGCP
jgi:hypothetical protein